MSQTHVVYAYNLPRSEDRQKIRLAVLQGRADPRDVRLFPVPLPSPTFHASSPTLTYNISAGKLSSNGMLTGRVLLDRALNHWTIAASPAFSSGPGATAIGEESAGKNCWNWNHCDAAYGS
jgi:hypothetical protein